MTEQRCLIFSGQSDSYELRTILTALGFDVDICATLEDAFYYMATYPYDAIIVEARLTDLMPGPVFAREMQKMAGAQHATGVSLHDAGAEQPEKCRMLAAGVQLCLERPFRQIVIERMLCEAGLLAVAA
ncbi:MAG: hypothetical protein HYS26_02480 [Candidatus Kaiserbacteria bacterium]|nr:MAG: hypothetical protein HYS26_02480 [Candidatus Kaiserbacteria bacterium]